MICDILSQTSCSFIKKRGGLIPLSLHILMHVCDALEKCRFARVSVHGEMFVVCIHPGSPDGICDVGKCPLREEAEDYVLNKAMERYYEGRNRRPERDCTESSIREP